jgi:hypothetical protein
VEPIPRSRNSANFLLNEIRASDVVSGVMLSPIRTGSGTETCTYLTRPGWISIDQ